MTAADLQPHAVALVVDPDFGDRLTGLARRLHVWAIDSPANHAAAESMRLAVPEFSLEFGITLFRADAGEERDKVAADEVSTIDLHHGQYSHSPPLSIIEVHGTGPTERLLAELAAHDFTLISQTPHGFTAVRPEHPT